MVMSFEFFSSSVAIYSNTFPIFLAFTMIFFPTHRNIQVMKCLVGRKLIRGIFSFLDFEKSWTYSHPNTTFARYSPRSQFRTAKMTLWHMRVNCEIFKNQKAENRNSKSIPTFKHWRGNLFQLQTPFSNKITWNKKSNNIFTSSNILCLHSQTKDYTWLTLTWLWMLSPKTLLFF